jgi:hypothetical protein
MTGYSEVMLTKMWKIRKNNPYCFLPLFTMPRDHANVTVKMQEAAPDATCKSKIKGIRGSSIAIEFVYLHFSKRTTAVWKLIE